MKLVTIRRTAKSSSLWQYVRKLEKALKLTSRGEAVEVEELNVSGEGSRGGVIRPTLYQMLHGFPRDGVLRHAVEDNATLRNADVTTVHDVAPFHARALMMLVFRNAMRRSVRRSRAVVVESEDLKDDVGRYLGRAALEKTHVIPVPFPEVTAPRPAPLYDLVWVSNTEFRKGGAYLLEQLSRLRDRRLKVMFVCHPGGYGSLPLVEAAYEAARPHHDITWIREDVPGEALTGYYLAARAYVATSTYESFHVPPMEAYLHGARAILPNGPPYRRLYGDIPGVSYYERSTTFLPQLAEALDAAPFRPDPGLIDRLSFRTVGRSLWDLYGALPGRR